MNENEDIAQLFACSAPPAPTEAFAAAVRVKIDRERRRSKAVEIGAAVVVVIGLAFAPFVVPTEVLHAIRYAQELLLTLPGVIASGALALALSVSIRLVDV